VSRVRAARTWRSFANGHAALAGFHSSSAGRAIMARRTAASDAAIRAISVVGAKRGDDINAVRKAGSITAIASAPIGPAV
jgi:hypothetical protein